MIEGIVIIVAVFIIGPALFYIVDEITELRAQRDFYRDFYDDYQDELDASIARHPATVSNMTRLRRIK